jgi:hypothetical protein
MSTQILHISRYAGVYTEDEVCQLALSSLHRLQALNWQHLRLLKERYVRSFNAYRKKRGDDSRAGFLCSLNLFSSLMCNLQVPTRLPPCSSSVVLPS